MNQRAHQRRADRKRAKILQAARHHGTVPIIPGMVPDLNDETKAEAMAEAHRVLEGVPGAVRIAFFPLELGLEKVRELWGDEGVATLREHLAQRGGTDPHVTLASRGFWRD